MVKVFRFNNKVRKKPVRRQYASFDEFDTASNCDSSSTVTTIPLLESPSSISEDGTATECSSGYLDEGESSVMTMVVYNPQMTNPSLPDSFHCWTHALLTSKEMGMLMNSSKDVVQTAFSCGRDAAFSAGGLVVHTACLPVTLPLHLACATTDLVCGVAGNVLDFAFGGSSSSSSSGESTSSRSPIDMLVHNAINFVPFVVGQTGKISQEVGGAVVHMVLPAKDRSENDRVGTSSGESSAEQVSFLNRLRLDIHASDEKVSENSSHFSHLPQAMPSDISKYLLRVDDVEVFLPPNPAAVDAACDIRALYIDLGKEFSFKDLTTDALGKLRRKALDIEATNTFRQSNDDSHRQSSVCFDWRPEGASAKNIPKFAQLPDDEYYKEIGDAILIWSGRSQGMTCYGSDTPIFMARGIVQLSPRDLLSLMWDSSRTSEYNNYNLGRKDAVIIDDNIASGGCYGAKVIKSETKVPYTGMSISLSTMMHATALDGGAEKGFIIVSRSLNSGMAGCHYGTPNRVEYNNKSEILLGANIMRAVPGRPDLCDLTSLSQVSSSVPNFLSFKIGMMGVEDFFNNIR